MKKHVTIQYEPVADPFKLPMPTVEIVECECHLCGAVTQIPVHVEYIDWQKVAELYIKVYEDMCNHFTETFKEAETVFNQPLEAWLETKHQLLTLRMEKLIEQYKQ